MVDDRPWEIAFENVKVPVENRIFHENQGWTCAKALLAHKPGDTVTVAIRRGDKRLNVRIKLGERPLDSPRRG